MGTMEGPSMDDGHLKESARTKKKKKGAWSKKIKVAVASIAKVLIHLNDLSKYSRGQRMVKELRQEEEMAVRRALEESMRDEFTGPAAAATTTITSWEDQMQLEESRKLREEQDREYEEALNADRRREEAQVKNEQISREEVPEGEGEGEEEVEKREVEKKKEEQPSLPIVSEAIATMGTISDLQTPPEPEGHRVTNEASSDDEFNNNNHNNPGREVTLAIRLPGGQRLQRQFRADDTIGDVRRCVDSIMLKEEREKAKEEGPFLLEDYDLVGSWPPSPHFSDLDQTLADAGLYPRALLCVQERI